jgi:hypothetical protein
VAFGFTGSQLYAWGCGFGGWSLGNAGVWEVPCAKAAGSKNNKSNDAEMLKINLYELLPDIANISEEKSKGFYSTLKAEDRIISIQHCWTQS